jgi:hypothetical protein
MLCHQLILQLKTLIDEMIYDKKSRRLLMFHYSQRCLFGFAIDGKVSKIHIFFMSAILQNHFDSFQCVEACLHFELTKQIVDKSLS